MPDHWLAAHEDTRHARASSFAGVAGIFFAVGQREDGEEAMSAAYEELQSIRPGRARFATLTDIAAALRDEDAARAADAAGEAREYLCNAENGAELVDPDALERLIDTLIEIGDADAGTQPWRVALERAQRAGTVPVLRVVAAGSSLLLALHGVPAVVALGERLVETVGWFSLE